MSEQIEALVRVTNNRPTLLHLPDALKVEMVTHDAGDGRQIQEPRLIGLGSGKSLKPGGNNIEKPAWERAKRHKEVSSWVRLGWITEGGDVSQPEGPLAPLNLSSYGVTTAVAMVEGEDDSSTLARWLRDEERPEVVTAIKRQIEARGAPKGRVK